MDKKTRREPIHAMASKADPDTLMYHKGMRANDQEEFMRAMMCEREDQLACMRIFPS